MLGFAARHRRSIVTAIVVALGGTGVTAFGIAPLMPDPAALPTRLVTEALTVDGLAEQLDALAAQGLALNRSTITRSTDGAEALLARLGVADAQAAAFLRQDPQARRLLQGRAGKRVSVTADANGLLVELVARFGAAAREQADTHFTRLTVTRVGERFEARIENAELASGVRLGSGTIRSSLFGATDDAAIPDGVATQLAEVFSSEIDFHRELRKGDTFSVVYETLTADGEPAIWKDGAGRLLAAEFVNKGKARQAMWFVDRNGRGSYFGLDGQSRRRAFLASPLEFSRVTSGFAMRLHPLMNTWRAHLGTDYAAPTGTPVRAVGEGVVDFAGRQNGYGNVVEVKHGGERSTLYAHLSRIDVKKGERVEQGQHIGTVGMTGWATGPHLHFEFRVAGKHQDPQAIAQVAEAQALDSADVGRLGQTASAIKARLSVAATMAGARPIED